MVIRKIIGGLKGWTWNATNHFLGNPGFGRIQLVSVCDEAGKEVYQQPVWLEQRGEIDIVVNDKQEIAFVESVRHAVIAPDRYSGGWHNWKPPKGNSNMGIPHPADLGAGIVELEIPRGFNNVLVQEAEEETRFKVALVTPLGHLNANTAFFGTSPFVYLCKAFPQPSVIPADPNEPIRQVV